MRQGARIRSRPDLTTAIVPAGHCRHGAALLPALPSTNLVELASSSRSRYPISTMGCCSGSGFGPIGGQERAHRRIGVAFERDLAIGLIVSREHRLIDGN